MNVLDQLQTGSPSKQTRVGLQTWPTRPDSTVQVGELYVNPPKSSSLGWFLCLKKIRGWWVVFESRGCSSTTFSHPMVTNDRPEDCKWPPFSTESKYRSYLCFSMNFKKRNPPRFVDFFGGKSKLNPF